MNEDRYVEYGVATGIVFVVLSIAGFVVFPVPPDLNAPAPDWASYFAAEDGGIRASVVLLTVATFFFIWFLGTLTSVLRIATGTPRLPSIAFAGGIIAAACLLVGLAAEAVAAFRPQGADPLLTRAMNDIFVMLGVAAIPGLVALLGATAVVILRTGAFPAWLGWLLVIAAASQPLTFGALFTKTGAFAGDGALGFFVPVTLSLIAVFALSALLTAWAREATKPGAVSLTDRIRGAVTGAASGAVAGARGERVSERPGTRT
jgi:hypothetical protein